MKNEALRIILIIYKSKYLYNLKDKEDLLDIGSGK